MTDSSQAIVEFLAARREEFLGRLEVLCRAESPSADAEGQAAVFAELEEDLAAAGCVVRRLAGRRSGGQLYGRPAGRRRGAPFQLLVGHVDTVWPRGSLREMPVQIEDGRMRGPGVYDMKAGVLQAVFALRALHETGAEAEVTPVVFFNSDEETGSRESTRRICLLARRADRAFVLEPSLGLEGRLKTARKGVGRFTLTVRGRAAHAGLDPEGGASAILELSHQIQRLFALNDPAAGVSVNVGMIDGGLGANVIAPESRAVIDVRVPTQREAERVEEAILALQPVVPGTRIEVSGGIGRPPMEPTPGNRRLWERARAVGEGMGLDLEEGTAGGGSDGNTTSRFTPTLDGMGAVGDGAHAAHEFLFIDRVMERTALLALLLLEPPLGLRDRIS